MSSWRFAFIPVLLALVVSIAGGQCALDTPYLSGANQDGNMFDVVCLNGNGITVTGFNCNLDFGFWDFEVYSCNLGTHVGNEQTPANWTLLGSTTQLLGNGEGQPTRIPIPISVNILPGQTQGFYVTCVDVSGTTTGINYTFGTAAGNVLTANADLQVLEGSGGIYPFGTFFTPRTWNGTVLYTYPGQPVDYTVNSAALTITIDGVEGDQCAPTQVTKTIQGCVNPVAPPGVLAITSANLGQIYDVVISGSPLVSASSGGFVAAPGQVVNIDVTQPFGFLSTGNLTSTNPQIPGALFPGSTATTIETSFTITTPGLISLQGFVLDPTSPIGLVLSQATEIVAALAGAFVPGPTADDGFVMVDVINDPCLTCSGGINFYGVNYSQIFVQSNGRVSFGGAAGAGDYSPSVNEAAIGDPFVGVWTDLSPGALAPITISSPALDVVRVDWNGLPFYGEVTTANTFAVVFDCAAGTIQIDGLQGVVVNPLSVVDGGDNQFLGISPGAAGGATIPAAGAVIFATPPGTGLASGTDMLYDFYDIAIGAPGQTLTHAAGTNNILFVPNAGNYAWISTP